MVTTELLVEEVLVEVLVEVVVEVTVVIEGRGGAAGKLREK